MSTKIIQKYYLNRRKFIRGTSLIGGLVIGSGIHGLISSCSRPSSSPETSQKNTIARSPNPQFIPDVEINLQAVPKTVQILAGQPTQVWSYAATLVKGDPASLQAIPDSYLGPIVRVSRGQRVRINFQNNLPPGQPSIVHWHGLILPEDMDGHPRFAIDPGQTYTYEFEVVNRAGTNWFYPHPDMLTGQQAYAGLAGLFIVTDPEEAALKLPSGKYDIPIVLQDRTLDNNNQLLYLSLTFSGAENVGGSNMGAGNTPELGAAMMLLKVKIDREEKETLQLPSKLASVLLLRPTDAVNATQPRPVELSLQGMKWVINGKSFEMEVATPQETVKFNSIEQWEIINKLNPGAMMDAKGMAHPIHFHGVHFQVISRQVLPELAAGWQTVKDGYIDEGFKDTVLVMPGERVKLLMKFDKYSGLYAYHCHTLEHEDAGMMRNYRIKS